MSDRHLAFLRAHRVEDSQHSQHSLLDHLQGTQALLQAWGQREAVCVAGLFHSVYGTESYRQVTIPQTLRPTVQQLIGTEAEQLAWLFGSLEQRRFVANLERDRDYRIHHRQTSEEIPISPQQFADLLQLIIANALEQLERVPPDRRVRVLPFFRRINEKLSGPAREALQQAITEIEALAIRATAADPTRVKQSR